MLSLSWLERNGSGLIDLSEGMLTTARAFVFERWLEREHGRASDRATLAGLPFDVWARERGWNAPQDLTNASKFSSLFTKLIFGGSIQGNADHQFNVIDGRIVDLTAGSAGLSGLANPYNHDPLFFGHDDHLASLASCMPRVRLWADQFALDYAPSSWLAPVNTRRGFEIRVGWRAGGREEFCLDFGTAASRDAALAKIAVEVDAVASPDHKSHRVAGRLLTPGDLAPHVATDVRARLSPSCAMTVSKMEALGIDVGTVSPTFERNEAPWGNSRLVADFEPTARLARIG